MKKILSLVLGIVMILSVAAFAAADEDIGFVTNKTLTLNVPGKAGGGSDLAIRYYAQALTDVYGLKTTVTNYDSNTIGHQMTANAKPDGTTLTLATGALNIQYITGNADINPMKDFTLIACMQDNGYSALAVPANAPYDDFNGFVEYAKANPGKINAGMPASGANTFLFGQLSSALGLELNSVECASESDRLTNLAGGFIDIGVVGVGNAVEYEKAGKLKVIGTVASDGTTIDGYPTELPENYKTLQEQGFKDCYFNVYHYLLGPAGMDADQVAKMNAAMEKIYEATKDQIATIGNIPGWHNLEESQKIREAEWNQLINVGKAIGLYVQGE
ncbi:MAG: tripartite tricarboxylate transporter substrate binding protein [Clostridia bacterium]|nr:tripartite tricarboxylate transporter substrate binding protein [Clostridia bacterium]